MYSPNTQIVKIALCYSNTSEIIEEFDLILKTKNALERYNRRLGECFFASHQNIAAFFVYNSSEMNERRKCGKGIK
ncbi:hypothetical protein HZS_5979 [Henneguya salminicola]|nr:hypothetical protein HZS_5979 [Henneguya salminicola]